MYSINRNTDGAQLIKESFDDCIELFNFMYEGRYTIKQDKEMANVWWVSVDDKPAFMVTSMQKAYQVGTEDKA